MKLLLIIDRVDYPHAVNPQLAYRLAEALAELGHTVNLLELWDGENALPPLSNKAISRFSLSFPGERRMNEALEHGNREGSPLPVRLARLLTHPDALRAAFCQFVLHLPRRQSICRAMLEQLDRDGYDAMLAVCAPYHAAFALTKARLRAKKALWMLDPYSVMGDPNSAAKSESLYRAADALFVTRQMEPNFAAGPLAGKTAVLEFPCLVPPPASPAARQHIVAFVGNLYPEIRTPHFALELFCALNDPQLTLAFAGSGWEHYPKSFLEPFRRVLGDRLVLLGSLAPQKARELTGSAEVLLNLGNANAEQLPSKIFEYFASGKPVLNLCKNPADPALPYFARYPLALTLQEADGHGPKVCETLRTWLQNTAGQQLPFEAIEALYKNNTPSAVAHALTEHLEKV